MSALIEAKALADILGSVKVLDASYGVPDAMGVFRQRHIGQAQFFDIDAVADAAAPYPHTLPDAAQFGAAVGALGIGNDDEVVIYDQNGISFAAARAWWMFRVMGHDRVRVLNGGLPAWMMAGLPVENGAPAPVASKPFNAVFRPALYRSFEQMEEAGERGHETIVDARNAPRFAAMVHTPDGDTTAAHIPGSVNMPFTSLLDAGGKMADAAQCSAILGPLNQGRAIAATCGSGVTACVLALGFYEAGMPDVAVYDGSWTEWSDRLGLR